MRFKSPDRQILVRDRETGEWYNPHERFKATMSKPEIQAVLKRLAAR